MVLKCILNEYKRNGCAQCSSQCAHAIAISGRIKASGLPSAYQQVTLSNSPARAEQAEIYRKLEAYAKTFSRQHESGGEAIKSVYLFSKEPGTGKTTTASALLNGYIIASYLGAIKKGVQPALKPAYFLDVNEWQGLYNKFNRKNVPQDVGEVASREYYKQMKIAKVAPFLVCDEIGIRDCSQYFRSDLHEIINARVTNELPTVYTSNVPIEQLAQVFDARLADRVRDQCAKFEFEGESKRGVR